MNHYEHASQLASAVSDAESVARSLQTHADGSPNFDTQLMKGTGPNQQIRRSELKDRIADLFRTPGEVSLFYFSGHGHLETVDAFLMTGEAKRGDEGLPMGELLTLANQGPAQNRVIVLDCCHSGIAGSAPTTPNTATLGSGVTVMTASRANEESVENSSGGLFTRLFLNALDGAAASLLGEVSPGAIYAHIDQALSAWDQRPVFKSNVQRFVSVRNVTPPISLPDLRQIATLFPAAGYAYPLDPSYEPRDEGRTPDMPRADQANGRIFSILQKYNRLNLLVPIDTVHMWNAAMESKKCRLTVLGEHYRRLVVDRRI